ncbi:MAG: HAD family hydrolase [Candidatus Bathyarchaeota archaeon]|nr:HAD family hydrolase [Candidatus Bathyarchaeota archaeon]
MIFDLGGTLLDYSMELKELLMLSHQSMTKYLVDKGFDVELDDVKNVSNRLYEAYTSFAETTFIEMEASTIYPAILYQLDIDDYANKDLIGGVIHAFYTPILDDYHMFKEVKEVLRILKAKRLKIGLITNNYSTDFSHRLLKKFDLENYFDSIVVSSEVSIRKPHKGIFLHSLKTLNVSHNSSIFIGDRLLEDVQGAKTAGIPCVWLNRNNMPLKPSDPHPDYEIHDLEELLGII